MTLETAVAVYGYPAVFIGAFLEGESVILAAGLLAAEGYFSYPALALAAAAGAFAGDGVFFLIGRCGVRRPGRFRTLTAARRLLDRHRRLVLLGYRFIYGFRGAVPFVLGAGRCPPGRFLFLSATGAVVWAIVHLSAAHWLASRLSPGFAAFFWVPPAAIGAGAAVAAAVGRLRRR